MADISGRVWSKLRRTAYICGKEIAEASADGCGSPSGDMMFWLFSFRHRDVSQTAYSWRPALGAPNGRAIAALMTFSGN